MIRFLFLILLAPVMLLGLSTCHLGSGSPMLNLASVSLPETGLDTSRFVERARSWVGLLEPAAPEGQSAPERAPEDEWLERELTRIGDGFDGQLGIAVVDIERGHAVHYDGERMYPQQSVSKLWVALAAMEQAERGELNLNDTGTVRIGDIAVFYSPIRDLVLTQGRFTATWDEFLRRSITQSDNTANDMLLRQVGGPDAVRDVLASKGLADIRFGPGERAMQSDLAGLEWDQSYALGLRFFEARKRVPHDVRQARFDAYVADPVDGATPLAIAEALARLARGELLGPDNTAQYLQWLDEVRSGPNRLKGGLELMPGWSLGHKTGTGQVLDIVADGEPAFQTGYNDVGIVTAPDGKRYAVAVMIGQTKAPVPERMEMMHQVMWAIDSYHLLATGAGVPVERSMPAAPAA